MLAIVVDSETTIRNQGEGSVGNFSGSPFHPDNYIVALGEAIPDDNYERLYYNTKGEHPVPMFLRRAMAGVDTRLVMHNGGFDWLYFLKHWPEEMEKAMPHLYLWDTQQAKYLLSGQTEMYPSLDRCAEELGLPLKDDRIKQYWKDGMDTTLIPKDELLEYLQGDLNNTWAVYQHQLRELADRPGLYELALVKMDDILATTMMSYNGMKFDLEMAAQKIQELDTRHQDLYNSIVEEGKKFFPEDFEFNPLSGDHISMVLFGGTYKQTEPVIQRDENGEPLRYKGGQKAGEIKTRLEKVEHSVKGLGLNPKKWDVPQKKNGHYSTDEEQLEKIDTPFTNMVVEFRGLEKDSTTYYKGYAGLVWHDGCIHPNINHESTRTGRQSCTNPNLQNVTKDED